MGTEIATKVNIPNLSNAQKLFQMTCPHKKENTIVLNVFVVGKTLKVVKECKRCGAIYYNVIYSEEKHKEILDEMLSENKRRVIRVT